MKKVALITGASSGIGTAAAFEFAKNDFDLILLGRNSSRLRTLQQRIPQSLIFSCDLESSKAISETIQQILNHPFGKNLEVLINNAGIFETHSFLDGTDELWMKQLNVNLMGPIRLTRALWPHFVAQKKASIVNVSSTLGKKPTAQTGAYSSSKAALINWTQSLALEGGPLGIRANVVNPGIIDTPIHPFHHLEASKKSEALTSLNPLQPLGRIGLPEEVAKAIYFLASEQSSWTTGTSLDVDGGISLS